MKILIVNPIIRYMEGGAEINDRSLAVAAPSTWLSPELRGLQPVPPQQPQQ